MFDNGGQAATVPGLGPALFGLVGRDPHTGTWVSYDPPRPPDGADLAPLGVLPDGWDLADPLALPPDDGLPASELPVEVERVPTGPELAAVLSALDETQASSFDVVEAAAGWARLISWAQAEQARVLAELTGRPELRPADTGYRSVNPVTNTAVEIAARTCTTTRQAENQVGHAVQLVHDFPATHRALAAGLIDDRRAKVITGELGSQDPAIRRKVEEAVLPHAPGMDSVTLRRRVKTLLHQLAPVDTAERCQQARQDRHVASAPGNHGMAHLEAFLPAEDVAAVMTVLNAAADTEKRRDAAAGREPRTTDQRRADALANLAWTALSAGHHLDAAHSGAAHSGAAHSGAAHRPGCACTCRANGRDGDGSDDGSPFGRTLATAQGRPVTVHLTFPFTSLIGLTDEPGELDGYGPIPAHLARHLAAAGIWTWVGTHPATGQVLDYGLTKYRPPQALIDYVVLRDRTCRTPGCHRPAVRCDIDHRTPFAAGGPTSACNCQALCKTHHLLKHHGRWKLERLPGGATEWVSPTGHRYLKPPEQVGPISNAPPVPPPDDDGAPF